MTTERCDSCRFWRQHFEFGPGSCHRRAPTFGHGWPSTAANDWCGDFQAPLPVITDATGPVIDSDERHAAPTPPPADLDPGREVSS